jgi:hypothetical protein
MKTLPSALTLFLLLATTMGCVTDDDMPAPADRLTSVELILRQPPTTQLTFRWVDNDGPGGSPAAFDVVTLPPNSSYDYTIRLLDLSDVVAQVDRTSEIRFLGTEYLVCTLANGNVVDSLSITDEDANGDPLGLEGTLTTGVTGNSQLRIVVRRGADKSLPSRCGLGELLLDALLPVQVE